MERYYKRLLAGEGRSEALRQVQLEMLASPVLRHPHYWAAFIPIGERGPIQFRVEKTAEPVASGPTR